MISPISLAFRKANINNRPALLTYTVAGDNNKKKMFRNFERDFKLC